jgi:hypothetical protein
MKEVNIYIRGICKNTGEFKDKKEGRYVCILEYKSKQKVIKGQEYGTTPNRMLLKALMKGLESLKEPCYVNIYTPTNLGFKSKNSPNFDLVKTIVEYACKNSFELKEIVSRKKQNELIEMLKFKDLD